MHRGVLPGVFALIILGIFVVPALATIDVTGSISPSGTLTSGTNVTVTQSVYILDLTDSTYVQMTTDLTSPIWQKTLFVDGTSSSLSTDTTSTAYISYSTAAHPNATGVYVQVVLTGIAPTVTSSTNKRMMQVQEVDSSDSIYYLNATVIPNQTLGNLWIKSSPSGAKVYFNSTDYQGTTPLNLTDLAVGTYTVVLKKSGYVTWGKEAAVTAGDTTTISATLVERPEETEATTVPTTASTTATPTKRVTTKATTPEVTEALPVATTESPISFWVGVSALCVAGILALRKK